MARHCMRPGCDRPAAAGLTYDTEAAAVWLDRPLDDGQPAQQVCSIHAATLTAPLGWTVTDRRLLAVGGPAAATPSDGGGSRPFAQRAVSPFDSTGSDPADPEPGAVPGEAAEEGVEALPDEPPAPQPAAADHRVAEEPETGSGADSKPRGKLLDRAFEWTGPQHSVLTAGHDHRSRRPRDQ